MRRIFLLGAAAAMLAAAAPSAFAQDDRRRDEAARSDAEDDRGAAKADRIAEERNRRPEPRAGPQGREPAARPSRSPRPLRRAARAAADGGDAAAAAGSEDRRSGRRNSPPSRMRAASPPRNSRRPASPMAGFRSHPPMAASAPRCARPCNMTWAITCRATTPAPWPPGPDLSSGSNFRRAQLGLQGKVFGDWSYYVNIDYGSGGSTGTETPGHIQQAYIEYDGFGPFIFRIGAHPPSTGLDDSYAASDQLLMERSAPGDLTRNMAGGDGRDSIELLYVGRQSLWQPRLYRRQGAGDHAAVRRTAGGGGARRLFARRQHRLALGGEPGRHRCVPPRQFHFGA